MRVRRVVPGRGMTSQASSHDFNRSSGNKTSEDEEAKDLKMACSQDCTARRQISRWTQQSEQRLCKPRAGPWPAPLHVQRRCMSSYSGGFTYVVLVRLRTGCARGGTCDWQHVKIRFFKNCSQLWMCCSTKYPRCKETQHTGAEVSATPLQGWVSKCSFACMHLQGLVSHF